MKPASLGAPLNRHSLALALAGTAFIFGVIFLLSTFGKCQGSRHIDFVGETNGYIVINDYIRLKFGRADCLKIVEKQSGKIIFQETIPSPLSENATGIAGNTLIAQLEDQIIRIDLNALESKTTRISELPGNYAKWKLDSSTNEFQAVDAEGRTYSLDPATLTPGAESSDIRPLQMSSKIPRWSFTPYSYRVNKEMRSPLFGPGGSIVLEDVGLVYPEILSLDFVDGQTVLVLLSSETIDQERWVLTGMDQTGKKFWQIRQSELAKQDRWFKTTDMYPRYQVQMDNNELLFLFEARFLRVNGMSGDRSILKSYK